MKCKYVICLYPRSTKEFARTRLEMPLHSKIELEFGDVGF